MLEMNKVMLIGNLTRDPELSYLANGTPLAKLGLAVSRRYKGSDGQYKDETAFVDVDVWRNQAEFCSKYLSKGRRVYVEGRLKYDTWENQDGSKRSKLTVTAERVQFADSKPTGDQQPQDDGYAAPQQQSAGYQPRQAQPAAPAYGGGAPMPRQAPAYDDFPESAEPPSDATADDLPF